MKTSATAKAKLERYKKSAHNCGQQHYVDEKKKGEGDHKRAEKKKKSKLIRKKIK